MKRFFLALVFVMLFVVNACANPLQIVVSCDDKAKVKDEIVSAMMGMETKSPVYLKTANDYQVVFDMEAQGLLASMFMNVRTLKKPVYRFTFDTVPQGEQIQIRAQVVVVENPDRPSIEVMGQNKDVDPVLYGILGFVKERVEGRMTLTMPEYIEQSKSKPQIGIFVDDKSRIVKVAPKSPAAKSGIKKGDIILEIDGEPAQGNMKWQLFEKREKGRTLKLRLKRKNKEFNVHVNM